MNLLHISQLALHLFMFLTIGFVAYTAFENPKLLAGTDMEQPLTLEPETFLPDRKVAGQIKESGIYSHVRATSRELDAAKAGQGITVYKTSSPSRPYLSAGQIDRIKPIYNVGSIEFSWRLFLMLGIIALWALLAVIHRRVKAAREIFDIAAPPLALCLWLVVGAMAFTIMSS
jgi:hypothetical protein